MNYFAKRRLTSVTIGTFACVLSAISQLAFATPPTAKESVVENHLKFKRERAREATSVSSFIYIRPSGSTLLVLSSNGTAACDLDGQSPCRFIDTANRDLLPLDVENVGTLLVDPLGEIECEPIGPARLPRALSCRAMQSDTRATLKMASIGTRLGDELLVITSHGMFKCTKGAGCVQTSWAAGAPVVGVSRKSDSDVSLVVPGYANGLLGCSVDFDAKSGRCWKKSLSWSDGSSIAVSFKQDRFALIRKSAAGLFVCPVRVDQSGIFAAGDRCNSRFQSAIADWSKLPVALMALGNGYARRIQTVSLLPMSSRSRDVRRGAQREILKHLREMRRTYKARQVASLDIASGSDAIDHPTFGLVAALMSDYDDDDSDDYLDYDHFNDGFPGTDSDLLRLTDELLWGSKQPINPKCEQEKQDCVDEFKDLKDICTGAAAAGAVVGGGLGCIIGGGAGAAVGGAGAFPGCYGGGKVGAAVVGGVVGTGCLATAFVILLSCLESKCK